MNNHIAMSSQGGFSNKAILPRLQSDCRPIIKLRKGLWEKERLGERNRSSIFICIKI